MTNRSVDKSLKPAVGGLRMLEMTTSALPTAEAQAPEAPAGQFDGLSLKPPAITRDARAQTLVEADLLVEDVSIDGMCGVY
jgi:mycofactocin precursor